MMGYTRNNKFNVFNLHKRGVGVTTGSMQLQIRTVSEGKKHAGFGSILDALSWFSKDRNTAAEILRKQRLHAFKPFAGQFAKARVDDCRQDTEVAPIDVIVELVLSCHGRRANKFRSYLSGAMSPIQQRRKLHAIMVGHASSDDVDTVVECLRQAEAACAKGSGVVYLVTSDILNGIKCGLWGGSYGALSCRYRCVYGPTTYIETFETDDMEKAEQMLLQRMKHVSIGGELVAKDAWDYVASVARTVASIHRCQTFPDS